MTATACSVEGGVGGACLVRVGVRALVGGAVAVAVIEFRRVICSGEGGRVPGHVKCVRW